VIREFRGFKEFKENRDRRVVVDLPAVERPVSL
jgi:hypothetical protein